jgi:hypothetical protein
MSTEEVLSELRKLNRADKLRAMEVLVLELVAEEGGLLRSGTQYEVWSPFDAPTAAESLTKLLEEEKKELRNG